MYQRTRWLLAVAVAATALTAAPDAPALAGPGPTAPTGTAPATSGGAGTYAVTLLTGDVVTVRQNGAGCPRATVRPVDPNAVIQQSCGPDGHLHVLPARVAARVGSVLDPALFDVTTLIENGYDDERSAELPVIVRPASATARVSALGGVRDLPAIGAVAGRVPKKSPATAKLATDPLLDGAARVWLDRRIRATDPHDGGERPDQAQRLDRNLAQIGAPQAWRAGYTGRGVRVAVLDSGADFTHPDLVGRVADRADFTVDGGDAVDHLGHGTHTASTIAGSGAASHGERRGVAPDAQLLVGKVLDDGGNGTTSQIIAGMEWAAARADVVSMSLGGSEPSDGTDPLSLAVDALTERTGALFVIAAGNSGGVPAAPGAAASALTVGAVDGADRVADFSSRGPLPGTWAAKPELTAPGVDIVAARAAGTANGTPVDRYYLASSGTSMATPHVAGAAALLAQRHPDWKADRLKAALVGAADPLPDADPDAVGAGRLNAARALGAPVSDQPVVNLGTLAYPQSGTTATALSWSGPATPAVVDLDLSLTVRNHGGAPVPARAVSLSTTHVRLRHGAPAGATLRLDRAALGRDPGYYVVTVTARTAGGAFVSSTPVTFYVEPPSHDLTIRTAALSGVPAGSDTLVRVEVTNLVDPLLHFSDVAAAPGESVTLRVPAGRYVVTGAFTAFQPETLEQRVAFVGDSDVGIGGPVAVTLDPAAAKPLTASVDGVAARVGAAAFTHAQRSGNGMSWWQSVSAQGDAATLLVGPLRRPGVGSLRGYAAVTLDSPPGTPDPYQYNLAHEYGGSVPADPAFRVSSAERARLARVDQRFNRVDVTGMPHSFSRSGWTSDYLPLGARWTEGLPANRVDYVSPGYLWQDQANYGGIVALEPLRSYQPGGRQGEVWGRQPLHSDWYDDPGLTDGSCAAAPARTRGNLSLRVVLLTDQHQRADCTAGRVIGFNRSLALYRDGTLLDRRDASLGNFTVPREAANYRLTFDLDTSRLLDVSTRVTTSWTFRSAGPKGTESVPLPLLSVDYALPLDADNHPVGGAGTFTVRQAHGVPAQRVTSFQVWTSLDDGANWRAVRVVRDGDGYRAELPTLATGQALSLRVKADADGGSGIDQTIVRAYRAG